MLTMGNLELHFFLHRILAHHGQFGAALFFPRILAHHRQFGTALDMLTMGNLELHFIIFEIEELYQVGSGSPWAIWNCTLSYLRSKSSIRCVLAHHGQFGTALFSISPWAIWNCTFFSSNLGSPSFSTQVGTPSH